MLRRRFLASLLALALAAGCAAASSRPSAAPPPRVLLISIDGFRADYRGRFATPVLDALARDGVSARRMQPAFPSKTFPNHFTLVTGLVPDHHGVVSNTMRDPEIPGVTFSMSNRAAVLDAAWWDAEPLWTTLERQGRRTAPLLWPGSEAPIGGIRPTHWVEYKQNLTDDERIAMVLEAFAGPPAEWPVFTTMYWHSVDDAGHRYGPDSVEAREAVEGVDRALGRLLQALEERHIEGLHVIVVSDHGMSALDPERTVYLDDYIDLGTADPVDSTPNVGLIPKTISVEQLYAQLAGKHPAMQVWRKEEIPARFQFGTHRRIPPVYVSMADGWSVMRTRGQSRGYAGLGNHGYDNTLESMQALFVAKGPRLKAGFEMPSLRSIDLYELMCRLLEVRPRPNDGDAAVTMPFMR